ncbi:MAG: asparaginase domain-containing protein [Pseudomonadota bacterium]
MTLRIIATGGTFDKHYDEIAGTLGFGESHLPQAIARARMRPSPVLEQLPFLDSLDMQTADRQRILQACLAAPETQIVIIHGTDTMADTAAVLGPACAGKTVVLTGSMIPYEVDGSDAVFNLGFACGTARSLPSGIYVAMNATVFAWDQVCKDRAQGIFTRLP